MDAGRCLGEEGELSMICEIAWIELHAPKKRQYLLMNIVTVENKNTDVDVDVICCWGRV